MSYSRLEPFATIPELRTAPLAFFLLDIPHLLYFGVIPAREAINQVLLSGGGGGGMSPGADWEPFEISDEEYWALVEYWETMPIQENKEADRFRYDPGIFIKDWEIMREIDHLKYLRISREKYAGLYSQRG